MLCTLVRDSIRFEAQEERQTMSYLGKLPVGLDSAKKMTLAQRLGIAGDSEMIQRTRESLSKSCVLCDAVQSRQSWQRSRSR